MKKRLTLIIFLKTFFLNKLFKYIQDKKIN